MADYTEYMRKEAIRVLEERANALTRQRVQALNPPKDGPSITAADVKKAVSKLKQDYKQSTSTITGNPNISTTQYGYSAITAPSWYTSVTPNGGSAGYVQDKLQYCDHQEASITQIADGTWLLSLKNEEQTVVCTPEAISGLVDIHNQQNERMRKLITILKDYGHRRTEDNQCWACGSSWPCEVADLLEDE